MQPGLSRVFVGLFFGFAFMSDLFSGTKMKISGNLKNDTVGSQCATLLNNKLTADAFNYTRLAMDLNFDFLGTDSTSVDDDDHVIKVHSTIRAKSNWGNVYDSFKTEESMVPFGKGLQIGSHSHRGTVPPQWIRELCLETRLDRIIGISREFILPNDPLQENQFGHKSPRSDLKLGYFFYHLGRGIAFGSGYGTRKSFLGIYNRPNDFAAPGVLLSNKFGPWLVDLYFCKYDARSSSFRENMSPKRERIIGHELDPWAGAGMDENLYSAKLEYSFNKNDWLVGKTYGFVFYDDAPARKTEFDYDASSQLGTWGLGCDFAAGLFEAGIEASFNFGQEIRYSLDRNEIQEVRDDSGMKVLQYSHILNATTGKKSLVTEAIAAEVDRDVDLRTLPNGVVYAANCTNHPRRIRPEFRTAYRGFSCVADAAYSVFVHEKKGTVKVAGEVGMASGDRDPANKETVGDLTRDYKGFIGLDESYSGNRVKSVIMLDDRNTRRPMTLVSGDAVGEASILSDSTFTDMIYYGVGANYKLGQRRGIATDFSVNTLYFYKYDQSKKIEFDAAGKPFVSDKFARSDLGLELNSILRLTFECGLVVGLTGAVFLPGGYYADIKGARLKEDAISFLTSYAVRSIPMADLSIGNDPSWYGKLEIGYRF